MKVWIASLKMAAHELFAIAIGGCAAGLAVFFAICLLRLLIGWPTAAGFGEIYDQFLMILVVITSTMAFLFLILLVPWTVWTRWSIKKDNRLKAR